MPGTAVVSRLCTKDSAKIVTDLQGPSDKRRCLNEKRWGQDRNKTLGKRIQVDQ